ncbi:MAG: response regulator transcription factor [Phreatobacter sp.]|nr:response regulator transcription factor [Phreatobacter sp.]MBL8569477.1 response regulator transcription factor [Phreatobacter sp.]
MNSPPTESLTGTHVLLVDDDASIRQLVAKFLRSHGFKVSVSADSRDTREFLTHNAPQLILLDVMLPGASGFELCREIRAKSAVPIIMLTARTDDTDRIVGLEIGADDYVTKPFNPRVLLARINAVLRRSMLPRDDGPAGLPRRYRFEGWTVDPLRRDLINPAGIAIDLTSGEFDLLLALVEAPQRVLSRDYLLDASKNRISTGFDRSIDVQMSRLRKKLGAGDETSSMIKTVRGIGYMFAPPVRRE